MAPVAVIDIGSNSIKCLVAERDAAGKLHPLAQKTLDARISAGISRSDPRLTEESMQRGLDAIRELLAVTAEHQPGKTILVATSAVRDARNGDAFRERVRKETGHAIRLLTGDEEANLIGRGLASDPALGHLRDFYVFDLGGGSLECLAFRERRVEQAISLQLGCVRLTEKFVEDPSAPMTNEAQRAVAQHTEQILRKADFRFSLPDDATAVGTGGTITTLRAMLAARVGRTLEESDTRVTLADFRSVRDQLAAMPLDERKQVPGIAPERADVFPAALTTLIAVAEAGRFDAYQHSLYNLRFGLAAEALGV